MVYNVDYAGCIKEVIVLTESKYSSIQHTEIILSQFEIPGI